MTNKERQGKDLFKKGFLNQMMVGYKLSSSEADNELEQWLLCMVDINHNWSDENFSSGEDAAKEAASYWEE